MALRGMLQSGLTLWDRSKGKAQTVLWTSEQFGRLILREISRVDRIGGQCAVVTFDLRNMREGRSRIGTQLADVLAARIRMTDDLGHLGDGVLAVLLSHTSAEGARELVEDVYRSIEGRVPLPEYVIHTYPSESDRKCFRGSRQVPVQPLEALLVQPLPRWKRALDMAGAGLGLALTLPIMLGAIVAIRCSSSGPAFYTQRRAGLGGRPFTIYKLRTMVVGAESQQATLKGHSEQDGPAFKLRSDPRVTPLGRLLRTTSIDELPQLWNVLRGDMSLVGPRPMDCREVAHCEAWHRRRHLVTPGLTCIWQVKGRSRVSFANWMRMDIAYAGTVGFLQDLRLLLETIPAVLMRRGAC